MPWLFSGSLPMTVAKGQLANDSTCQIHPSRLTDKHAQAEILHAKRLDKLMAMRLLDAKSTAYELALCFVAYNQSSSATMAPISCQVHLHVGADGN